MLCYWVDAANQREEIPTEVSLVDFRAYNPYNLVGPISTSLIFDPLAVLTPRQPTIDAAHTRLCLCIPDH